ncbi:MAG: glycosyltransferase family 2 protein [Chitinophagaceae bacterium]|nr:glycosyltransferase family 2 protein [Chitinophagaceae bacterium]
MKLSVVIPAYNEEACIKDTIESIYEKLRFENIEHEIFVTDDNSKDNTIDILKALQQDIPVLKYETNAGPPGFGYSVRLGLERFSGDCVIIVMADKSDDPQDIVSFYKTMVEKQVDCVFGNRWGKGGRVINYPRHKYLLNRTANLIIRCCFRHKYNDTTNAFKLYKREVIEGVKPFLSPHFNLTIEIPLKAVIRGYSFCIIPNSWSNRKEGGSNLKIREMGSRYFFILLYCLIEKFFSKGDYLKINKD